MADKPKIYEKIKHDPNALICDHCSYADREKWLQVYIKDKDMTKKIEHKDPKGNPITETFKNVRVIRGKYNDVIGVAEQWS